MAIEIYGIINATPDSFFVGSRVESQRAIIEAAHKALSDGADILDIGGYSTRPGYSDVPVDEEYRRLYEAISIIKREFPEARISVDTFRSEIVRRVYDDFGSFVVNDIQGGVHDKGMLPIVGELSLPYVMMSYDATIESMIEFFTSQIAVAENYGVSEIMLDAGYGFGKTLEENFTVLKNQYKLKIFNRPIFAGLSRKSMIWKSLGTTPLEALNGTTALNFAALERGATILRVHDVKEARQCATMYELINR